MSSAIQGPAARLSCTRIARSSERACSVADSRAHKQILGDPDFLVGIRPTR